MIAYIMHGCRIVVIELILSVITLASISIQQQIKDSGNWPRGSYRTLLLSDFHRDVIDSTPPSPLSSYHLHICSLTSSLFYSRLRLKTCLFHKSFTSYCYSSTQNYIFPVTITTSGYGFQSFSVFVN